MNGEHAVKGMHDVLPKEHDYFTFIKKVVRYHARRTGLKRISLPGVMNRSVLETAFGKGSEMVSRGLLSVSGDEYVMRSDCSSAIARSYVAHCMHKQPQPVEFYYIDQVWHNQFDDFDEITTSQEHRFGFDLIGEEDSALDAQLIEMGSNILKDLGLQNVKVTINNVGSREAQEKYNEDLRNFFAGKERSLSEDDLVRLEHNPMRLLSSKNEDTQILAKLAPTIASVLDKESKEHFEKLKEYLEVLEIPYEVNERLFLDADMYSHAIFIFEGELVIPAQLDEEGNEITQEVRRIVRIGQGGRYNYLVKDLGGEQDAPAVGAFFAMETIAALMTDIHLKVPSKDKIDVFIIQLGDDAKKVAIKLASDLRHKGIKTLGALGKASIRSQLDSARDFDVRYSLVMGQMEVREKKIIIRDMQKGTQEIIPFDGIVDRMIQLLGESTLDTQNFKAMIEEASEID